jgi:hypothetical protein
VHCGHCGHCGPRGLPPATASLYRNNGDGTFTDVSAASGIAAARGRYMMTAVAADFDNDGWPDIYVACDSTPSLLFRNNHNGTFTESGLISGVAVNEDGHPQAGMGLAIGDYNLDATSISSKRTFPTTQHSLPQRRQGRASSASSLLSSKTIRRHVDNVWMLGGEIIRDLHYDPSLRKLAAERLLRNAIHEDGGPLLHSGSEEEQRSFDATCRQLHRFLNQRSAHPVGADQRRAPRA